MLEAYVGNRSYAARSAAEAYFEPFREQIIGQGAPFDSPYERQRMLYADWAASGRLYQPIEKVLVEKIGPYAANTHTESNVSGNTITRAYEEARNIIKAHVNAGPRDVLLFAGFGMTAAVNKLQRILGLKRTQHSSWAARPGDRPVIFVTHMEHHSNQISWAETIGEVVCIPPGQDGGIHPAALDDLLHQYRDRRYKIGAFTACSNITGIVTPYHQLAKVMHEHGGICCVDFAASAPYAEINMHPADPMESLDAIYFSPHKFLGGPGSSGVLLFDSALYGSQVPDHPGGGTVAWTNPWGGHQYLTDIEKREDGGTPGFMQAIRTALCLKLKETMDIALIRQREQEMTRWMLKELRNIPGLQVLAEQHSRRLGIISFHTRGIHYNLFVRLLNDRFGIQARGGCSCAGTYGHYLMNIDPHTSKQLTDLIDAGDLSRKPGWVRLSLHPTMTNRELGYIVSSITEILTHIHDWSKDYSYDRRSNEWSHLRYKQRVNTAAFFEI